MIADQGLILEGAVFFCWLGIAALAIGELTLLADLRRIHEAIARLSARMTSRER